LIIDGGEITGGRVASAGDHRIAMSFAMAGLVSTGPIEVLDTGPVATSFPEFVATAAQLGLTIALAED
jgi:3-phosphoshikimate 1-carboxyvinyltransferase